MCHHRCSLFGSGWGETKVQGGWEYVRVYCTTHSWARTPRILRARGVDGQMSIWRIEIFGQSGNTTSVNLVNIFERVDNVENPEEQPSNNF